MDDLNKNHVSIKENHFIDIKKQNKIDLKGSISVNSYHHQAIKELAPNFEAIGHHSDGTIELIIHKTLPILGVQWHPEIDNDLPYSDIIFNTFLNKIK